MYVKTIKIILDCNLKRHYSLKLNMFRNIFINLAFDFLITNHSIKKGILLVTRFLRKEKRKTKS